VEGSVTDASDLRPPCRVQLRAQGGRYLKVVVAPRPAGLLRFVTCWPMNDREIERYEAWRKTVMR
jgi:hypothetical protein